MQVQGIEVWCRAYGSGALSELMLDREGLQGGISDS